MKPPAPQGQTTYRILVVEDDPEIAKLILAYLGTLSFECHHAADGPAGLDAFTRVRPHLVLMDLALPGLSGHEVLTKIRETSTIPITVLTAMTEEGIRSFKLGADDFVTKPFDPKLLVARVVAQLRRAYKYDYCAGDEETAEATEEVEEFADEDDLIPEARSGAYSALSGSKEPGKTPSGWATCDACGYIGPRERFEHEDFMGRIGLLCPNCKESDRIVFSIG